MTRVTLFSATIGAGPALAISVTRNFDSSDPFTVGLGNDAWPLATNDAERLAAAGRRIEGRLDYCAQRNEPVEEAAYFRRQLGNSDGRALTFEIGIDASGPIPPFTWNGQASASSTALAVCSKCCRFSANRRRQSDKLRRRATRRTSESTLKPFDHRMGGTGEPRTIHELLAHARQPRCDDTRRSRQDRASRRNRRRSSRPRRDARGRKYRADCARWVAGVASAGAAI
jgi:hypothetical protein